MTQSRVWDFGALLTQAREKAFATNLFVPGVYEGLVPSVPGPALVQFSAGAFLLPNGVLVMESTGISIPPPLALGSYTLIADHADIQAIGGSPVTYSWQPGILARSGSPNPTSLALAWLRLTGPLAASMLNTPPIVKNGAGLAALELVSGRIQAPFAFVADLDLSVAPNVVIRPASSVAGPQYIGALVTNSAPFGSQSYTFKLPIPLVPVPRYVDFYVTMATGASVTVTTATASDGSSIALTPNAVAGPVTSLASPAVTMVVPATAFPVASISLSVVVPALTTGLFFEHIQVRGD